MKHADALVDGDWLEQRLNDATVKVVDGSWFFEGSGRDALIEFELRHIPGAVLFNIDDVCDPATGLPHMVPSAERFAEKVGTMGIANTDTVVVYDSVGGFSAAARVWWMFRLFGHDRVAVLDGGLKKWWREKRPVAEGTATTAPASFRAMTADPALIRHRDQLLANIESGDEVLVDARSAARFTGQDPEPRPAKRMGHIPKSVNLFFADLMNPRQDYTMIPQSEIRAVFHDAGIDIERPMAITYGSGVTACIPALALYLMGIENVAIYDGSWAEWGDDVTLPLEI